MDEWVDRRVDEWTGVWKCGKADRRCERELVYLYDTL